ncbi:MAG: gliding motility-associated C-terminal domain-containing protein [Bacteroidetes bacterium]|nr:gliding motility-associated C-terminal domain-containing protein [Bacteroidota bacterium]
MKSVATIFICIAFFSLAAVAVAQEKEGSEVYRVTAFKKGNNKILSQSNTVEITPGFTLYIPDAFTPNNDRLNDTFGAVGKGIVEYKMVIYDRWGNFVFESTDINKQWDGTFLDVLCKQDMYVYRISASGENTQRIIKTGSLMLLQ